MTGKEYELRESIINEAKEEIYKTLRKNIDPKIIICSKISLLEQNYFRSISVISKKFFISENRVNEILTESFESIWKILIKKVDDNTTTYNRIRTETLDEVHLAIYGKMLRDIKDMVEKIESRTVNNLTHIYLAMISMMFLETDKGSRIYAKALKISDFEAKTVIQYTFFSLYKYYTTEDSLLVEKAIMKIQNLK